MNFSLADSMPDYYLVLSEAILNVFTCFDAETPDDRELRPKAMACLNNLKWAMIRAEQWEEEYDEEVTERLKEIGYHEVHLRQWAITDKPNDEPDNSALANNFNEDQLRHKETGKPEVKIQFHWIKDEFDARNSYTAADFRDWQTKLRHDI